VFYCVIAFKFSGKKADENEFFKWVCAFSGTACSVLGVAILKYGS